jgi:hypothetical protein
MYPRIRSWKPIGMFPLRYEHNLHKIIRFSTSRFLGVEDPVASQVTVTSFTRSRRALFPQNFYVFVLLILISVVR